MTKFSSILVATDFSDHATHAVRTAAHLARQHAARLTLLHVVDPDRFRSLWQRLGGPADIDARVAQARARLRAAAAHLGVRARSRIAVGHAVEEILRASHHADLLVVGRRRRHSLGSLVAGGTAARLLRGCRRPMLVVRRPFERSYRNVLVPVGFTAHSRTRLHAAASLLPLARMHVFHALESTPDLEMQMAGVPDPVMRQYGDIVDRRSRFRMHAIAADAGVGPGRLTTAVRRGPAWACTLEEAGERRADLIVVGRHKASSLAERLFGSLSRRVLAHASCDVMVMPSAIAEARCTKPAAPHAASGPVARARLLATLATSTSDCRKSFQRDMQAARNGVRSRLDRQ